MDDAQIVALFFQRSESAIAETAARYGAYCRSIARNVLSDEQDAEECVNDAYLAAWNSIPPNRPARLSAYLGKITRNCALDRLSAQRAQKRGGGETTAALSELEECLLGGGDPQAELSARELAEAVNRFLSALPETERAVFVARYWFLTPVGTIAERFGFSVSKTASMLFRTRKKLRQFLAKEELL